ncbi:hypothetical protein TNCV_3271291 [Trichonephila clavipes]|nr:hypothetical protein TNCV_3271291 [Trichonephila clavipes]
MDVTLRKRTRIVTLSQHTSMVVKDIAAAVGDGKSNISKEFGAVSPKQTSKCGRNRGETWTSWRRLVVHYHGAEDPQSVRSPGLLFLTDLRRVQRECPTVLRS